MGKGMEWALQAQPCEDVERAGGGGWHLTPDTSSSANLLLFGINHVLCVCERARGISKV